MGVLDGGFWLAGFGRELSHDMGCTFDYLIRLKFFVAVQQC